MVSLNPRKHFPLKLVPVGFSCWEPRPLTDGVPYSCECLLALESLKKVSSLFLLIKEAKGTQLEVGSHGNKLDGVVSGSNEYSRA